jgi:hypothetical protein
VVLIVVSAGLYAALRVLSKPGFLVATETCVCGAVYTLRLDYPTYLTLDHWEIVTVTLTDEAGSVHMFVPFQANATVQPMQGSNEWCNLIPSTKCIMQWAIKASVPGDIRLHVLPTFMPDDPKSKVRQRWDIRSSPIMAGDSVESIIEGFAKTARDICLALTAVVALVAAILGILAQRKRQA